jgi:hypothetical protein
VLERVALSQTRFNVPGIVPDPRGVVLGQKGLVLLPTVERLVSFFRVYGDQDSIDELLPTLSIRQVRTQLGTREFVASFDVSSSYQMDRCASIAKMLGGLAFTGTSRHFVKYRDASSPMGYDASRLIPQGGDIALYHEDFSQAYETEREVPFRSLVLRLSPRRVTVPPADLPEELLLTVAPGLSGAVQGYLYRNGAEAEMGLAEWPAESAFDEAPRRLFVFRCQGLPARIVALMEATPGVEVFVPLSRNVAVERGFRHPIYLPSCMSVFGDGGLYLFSGTRDRVDVLADEPHFADIKSLSSISVDLGAETATEGRGARPGDDITVGLRLVPTSEPWRRIYGVSIPWSRAEWLRSLVYTLPPRLLRHTKVHVSNERIVVLGETGVEAIPLGTLLTRHSDAILVAAGYAFLPHVSPDLLEEIVGAAAGELHVFEPGEERPYVLREADLQPLGLRAVSSLPASRPDAFAPRAEPEEEAEVRYHDLGAFPLWGLPGRREGGKGK